jgi:hypothetical protein
MKLVHSVSYYTPICRLDEAGYISWYKKAHIHLPVGIQVDVFNSCVKENALRVWGLA